MQQAVQYPWRTPLFLSGRPTVGTLMSLCEVNYLSLLRLIPDLKRGRGEARSALAGGLDLHLEVLEQTPYTTLLRITYFFHRDGGRVRRVADPDALLRAYHDARQVEVLDLKQTVLPICNHYQSPALETKWRVNLFLGKWLTFCIRQGHRFSTATGELQPGTGGWTPLRVRDGQCLAR